MSQDTDSGTGSPAGRADEPRTEPDLSSITLDREWKLAWLLVAAVGVAYLVTQLAFFPFGRPSNWDEAVYLSQVTPGMDALFMDAWRSRGIVLLIAPVRLLGGTLPDVRLFLTITSATAVTLAFGLWISLIGLAAPVAAFLFSFMWFALISGSAIMPNFWAAVAGVAVAGLVARRLEGGSLRAAVLAATLLCAMALLRPTEAIVLVGAIGLYLAAARRSSWRLAVGLGVGVLIGWLPWILEMSIRFGGVSGAFRRANSAGHLAVARIGENVLTYLAFTYGRRTFVPNTIPIEGIVWWSLLVILAGVALLPAVKRPARSVVVLSIIATAFLAFEYLVLVPFVAWRFLLPAYAFAAVTAAIGLVWLLRRGVGGRVVGAVLLVLMVPWALWQLDMGRPVLRAQVRLGERYQSAGLLLRDLAGDRPCSFVSLGGYPQVQIASGCSGAKLVSKEPTRAQLAASASGDEVFVILPHVAGSRSSLAALDPTVHRYRRRMWFIYQLSQLRTPEPPG